MRARPWPWLLLAALAVLLLAGACAPAPAPEVVTIKETVVVAGTPQVVEKQVEVTKVVEKVVEVVPEPVVDQERAQTLNVAISKRNSNPTQFNVYAPGSDRSRTGMHQLAYEYLFYQNLQTGEYIPWLAESFEYNDDFTAITVKLRDGVKWNDGQPFSAEDVVFTYDTLRDNPSMTWAAEANKWVASVEAIDDLTVVFNLTGPNPRVHLNREAFPAVGIWGGITILAKHHWQGEDPLQFTNHPPVSTGPYKLVGATETAISWERRDDWWGTEVFGVSPAPRWINYVFVGPETNVALALMNNEIDTPQIGILTLGSFLEVAKRNPNVRAWDSAAPFTWLDPCPRGLMVQNAHPPLDDARVRQALSHLIDRDAVVELAYEGATTATWGVWPSYDGLRPFFDSVQGLLEEHQPILYDADRAQALFEEAGVDPATLTLNFLVDSGNAEDMKVTQVVADQLEAGGLTVEIQALTGPPQAQTRLVGDWDLAYQPFCPGYIFDNLELFHSKYYVPLGETAPWYERNSFRYQNPAFDAAVDAMASLQPEDPRNVELFAEAMAIWFQDLPVIPMVQAPALVPFNYTYWEGWPSGDDPWNMPVSWWATFNLVIAGYPDPDTGEWVGGIRSAFGAH